LVCAEAPFGHSGAASARFESTGRRDALRPTGLRTARWKCHKTLVGFSADFYIYVKKLRKNGS
jgi:hypothetical protein